MKKVFITIISIVLILQMGIVSKADVYVPDQETGQEAMSTSSGEISNFTITIDTSGFGYDWNEIVEVLCTKDGEFFGDYDLSPINHYTYGLFLVPGQYTFLSRVRYDRFGLYYLDNASFQYVVDEADQRIPKQYIITAHESVAPSSASTEHAEGVGGTEEMESAYSEIEEWERKNSFEYAIGNQGDKIDAADMPKQTGEWKKEPLLSVSGADTEKDTEKKHGNTLIPSMAALVILIAIVLYLFYLKRVYDRRKSRNE